MIERREAYPGAVPRAGLTTLGLLCFVAISVLFAVPGEVVLRGFDEPVRLYEVRWREE